MAGSPKTSPGALKVGPAAPTLQNMSTAPKDAGERWFDLDELFFSYTNKKAIIRSGNEVFVRVSGFEREELVGRSHNVVRHPDMPRSVFQVFWDRLNAGSGVSAYVKNRAKDGTHYWVFATVDHAPGGYLSIRVKPSGELFKVVQGLYTDLLALERKVENGDPKRRKAAIAAGLECLEARLAAAGFADYQALIRAALPEEMRSRDARLGASAAERLGDAPDGADPRLVAVLNAGAGIYTVLDDLSANLERYAVLQDTLAPKSAYMHELADSIRLFSLNALISATRLGDRGAALGAVADIMRSRSHTAAPITQALSGDIGNTVDLLAGMGYRIAQSKLEAEMMLVFVHELFDGGASSADAMDDLGVLVAGLNKGVGRLGASLSGVRENLESLAHHAARLSAELGLLRRLEVNGRIEASRIGDAEAFLDLFATIGQNVTVARGELTDFDTIGADQALADETMRQRLDDGLIELEEHVGSLGVRVAAQV